MKRVVSYVLTVMMIMMSMVSIPVIAEKPTSVGSYYADTDAVYLNIDGLETDDAVDISSAVIILSDKDNAPVTANVSADNNTVIITPSAALSTGQIYTVKAIGLKTAGGVVVPDYTKSFRIVEILNDDFDGSTVDTNKWTVTDDVVIEDNRLKLTDIASNRVFSKDKFSYTNYSVKFAARLAAGQGNKAWGADFKIYTEKSGQNGGNTQYNAGFNYMITQTGYTLQSRNEGWGAASTLVPNQSHNVENIEEDFPVKIVKQNSKGLYKVGGESSTFVSPYDLSGYLGFENVSGDWSKTTAWIDNLLVTTVEDVVVSENVNVASYYADTEAVYLNMSGVEDSDTLSTNGVVLKDKNGETVNTTVTADGNTLVITPASALVTGEKYTVEATGMKTENGGIIPPYTKNFQVIELVNEDFSSDTIGKELDYSKDWWKWGGTSEVADGRLKMEGSVIRLRNPLPSRNYSVKLDLYNDNLSAAGTFDNDIRISASKIKIKDNLNSSLYQKGLNYSITAKRVSIEGYYESWKKSDIQGSTAHNITFTDAAVPVCIVNQNGNGKYKVGESNVCKYTYDDVFDPGYFGFIMGSEAKWSADNIRITSCADWIEGVNDGEVNIEIISSVKAKDDDGNVSANVKVNVSNNNCKDYTLFAAVYDEAGKFIGIGYGEKAEQGTSSQKTITIANTADAKTVKVMAWNSMSGIYSVANVKSAEVK